MSHTKKARGAAKLPLWPRTLKELAKEAEGCRNCELWRNATHTVFGEGKPHAPIMLVGEQPGDQEDVQGKPFVGPAGQLLKSTLEEAGIELSRVYLTNAVKHFKWEPGGKRRIHKKPSAGEIAACMPWLECRIKTESYRVPGCDGCTDFVGKRFSGDGTPWRAYSIFVGAFRDSYGTSLFDLART